MIAFSTRRQCPKPLVAPPADWARMVIAALMPHKTRSGTFSTDSDRGARVGMDIAREDDSSVWRGRISKESRFNGQ